METRRSLIVRGLAKFGIGGAAALVALKEIEKASATTQYATLCNSWHTAVCLPSTRGHRWCQYVRNCTSSGCTSWTLVPGTCGSTSCGGC